ncbi:hypothetical protein FA09DRAFT_260433 [Tilletiopsis washingtonensis]|jgi:hypothetical protein|uniref:Uncharacterized protein n=1 Tax=Tilletiopsis washingtonensis TaxID=58919 RepID=A0A316Z9W3_9BASI|nr:hypothetical protein FA09DRAFT_260433 [Tilletiopsis washingtonensis]PWN98359.1 hypothetical protein FA09DRAFT_260433 [Tilletiopsis washingtonensis]
MARSWGSGVLPPWRVCASAPLWALSAEPHRIWLLLRAQRWAGVLLPQSYLIDGVLRAWACCGLLPPDATGRVPPRRKPPERAPVPARRSVTSHTLDTQMLPLAYL